MKVKFNDIFKAVKSTVVTHSPEILTAIGITGMISSTVLAVKATPKAMKLLDEKKKEVKDDTLTKKEVIKTTWKCYIPTATTCVLSAACLVGSTKISLKRNAALAAAYALSDSTFKAYKEKVSEKLSEKKMTEVKDEVAKEKVNATSASNSEIFITGNGSALFYDAVTGRYFRSDIEKVRKVVNDINRQMRDEMFVSLNEFLSELGLPPVKIGDELGWNIDSGYIDTNFSTMIADNNQPCIVLDYLVEPRFDYRRLM